MSKTTTIRTEFRCITFEEFAIREGYPTFSVARDGIYNNKMTQEYGPNWRMTWRLTESEREEKKRKKELEEKRRSIGVCKWNLHLSWSKWTPRHKRVLQGL